MCAAFKRSTQHQGLNLPIEEKCFDFDHIENVAILDICNMWLPTNNSMTRYLSQTTTQTTPSTCSLQLKCCIIHIAILYLRWYLRKGMVKNKSTKSPDVAYERPLQLSLTTVTYTRSCPMVQTNMAQWLVIVITDQLGDISLPFGVVWVLIWIDVQKEHFQIRETVRLFLLLKSMPKSWSLELLSFERCTYDAGLLHLDSACLWHKTGDTVAAF